MLHFMSLCATLHSKLNGMSRTPNYSSGEPGPPSSIRCKLLMSGVTLPFCLPYSSVTVVTLVYSCEGFENVYFILEKCICVSNRQLSGGNVSN